MYGAAHYIDGNGTGTIWLDDLQCLGEEKSVQDCNYRGWGKHNCGHHKDVGVRCQNTSDIPTYKEEGSCDVNISIYIAVITTCLCFDICYIKGLKNSQRCKNFQICKANIWLKHSLY